MRGTSRGGRSHAFAAAIALSAATDAALAQCARWLPGDGYPGVGQLSASTVWDPDGPGPGKELFIAGGSFATAGSTLASNVAAWDGAAWYSLGAGVNEGVSALEVHNGDLIVGGAFTAAGGVPASGAARWDGDDWHALGTGAGTTSDLEVHQGALFASRYFWFSGPPVIARWGGQSWNSVGVAAGVDPFLGPLTSHAGNLFAGGHFTSIDGVPAQHIARWDGATWHAVGLGVNGIVGALAEFGGDLVAGGEFTAAGGVPADRIARWDGTRWHPLGTGMTPVKALATYNGQLIAGGWFTPPGGSVTYIARWDGSAWQPLGDGIYGGVGTISVYQGSLIAGGLISSAGGQALNGVARWDGEAWHALAPGFSGGSGTGVTVLAPYQGDIVAGGSFARAGWTQASNVARWDGAAWHALGSGVDLWVTALGAYAGDLIAAGAFSTAGGAEASRIAAWDGASWSALGGGLSCSYPFCSADPRALIEFEGDLFVGGRFGLAGGLPVPNLARWDGQTWHPMPDPLHGASGSVHTLHIHAGALYLGGEKAPCSGCDERGYVARWNGATWQQLGELLCCGTSGLGSRVHALASFNGQLVAGGEFTSGNLVHWNGGAWQLVGGGVSGNFLHEAVYSMTVHQGALVVSGHFNAAGGQPAHSIARWNGAAWSALGSGVGLLPNPGGPTLQPKVRAVALHNGEILAAGNFVTAGGEVSAHFARWTDTGIPWVAHQPEPLTVHNGGAAKFRVTAAAGYADVQYLWRRNGVTLVNGPGGSSPGGGTVLGQGTPEITITGVRASDAGAYKCWVSNACGYSPSTPALLTVTCYADCNGNAFLGIGDFACFQTRFLAQDPYADCDVNAALTITDFACFQAKFVAGCP